MSLQSAIRARILNAADAAGFVTTGATTPREMKGVGLPALYLRLFKVRAYDQSPGLSAQQMRAEVEVLVFTPETEDAPAVASGPLAGQSFGGIAGAQAAHDLAFTALGAADCRVLRSVQYAGPTGGRDVFVTAFVVEAFADVFNDLS